MRVTETLLPVLLVALLAAGCSGGKYRETGPRFAQSETPAQFAGLREPEWREIEVELPEYPKEADLQPFELEGRSKNRFYIDSRSLSVDEDGVVRYTVVARMSTGIENVSYEGIRCDTAQWKSYAFGRPDKTWAESRSDDWRRVERVGVNAYHVPLYHAYFCPWGLPVSDAGTALSEMRRTYGAGPLSERQ